MIKKHNEYFEISTKCWICDNPYVDRGAKVRNHCHIIGRYSGSAHRDCNINVKLNHKTPVAFHNLKNYDSHVLMQELVKSSLRIKVTPNGLEKYTSFSKNNN